MFPSSSNRNKISPSHIQPHLRGGAVPLRMNMQIHYAYSYMGVVNTPWPAHPSKPLAPRLGVAAPMVVAAGFPGLLPI